MLTDDQVGVLVHLGIDTVQLNGEGSPPTWPSAIGSRSARR
ncbi:MAG: hypothetical protein R2703_10095 [Micropruina glycogenica]